MARGRTDRIVDSACRVISEKLTEAQRQVELLQSITVGLTASQREALADLSSDLDLCEKCVRDVAPEGQGVDHE